MTSWAPTDAWQCPGCPGLAPGVPCGVLGMCCFTHGGSEEEGAIGVLRVSLHLGLQSCHPCLKGADPFVLLPNHRQQVNDHLLDDPWRLFPARGIKRQSLGQWKGGATTAETLARVPAYVPLDAWMPPFITQTRQTSSRNWLTSLVLSSYIFTP